MKEEIYISEKEYKEHCINELKDILRELNLLEKNILEMHFNE